MYQHNFKIYDTFSFRTGSILLLQNVYDLNLTFTPSQSIIVVRSSKIFLLIILFISKLHAQLL